MTDEQDSPLTTFIKKLMTMIEQALDEAKQTNTVESATMITPSEGEVGVG